MADSQANKQTKKKRAAPSRKHQLTKEEVKEIVEKYADKPQQTIANKHNCSISQVQKMFKLFNNTNWKPADGDDILPKGYMFPKSINQVVESVMYDMGYVTAE